MADAGSRLTATRNRLLLALAFAAGYIDALSYLGLSRVFTANMTGNTVLLGIAVAQLDGDAALRSGLALAGFLAGAAAGAWIVERDHSESVWPPAVMLALILEWLILVAFAVGWQLAGDALPEATPTAVLIVLSALAMGVQSAAIHRLEVTGIATTYITGTLTNLVARLMGRARRKRRPVFAHSALLAAVWIVYLGGAATAAVDLQLDPVLALALPAVLIMLVIFIAARASDRHHSVSSDARDEATRAAAGLVGIKPGCRQSSATSRTALRDRGRVYRLWVSACAT